MTAPYRVTIVIGTRPEAIKLAPVILALRPDAAFACRVCATAQHREMLDQVLPVFGLAPDEDLGLMRPRQSLADLTARALCRLQRSFRRDRPDLVLVQGDTTSVLCAALAAFYNHIPVGHVEAGLRTGDLGAPWPEEGNRVLTARLARLHFAPTERARQNLLREGIPPENVHLTGNTVIDALQYVCAAPAPPAAAVAAELGAVAGLPGDARVVLITGHRRENVGAGLNRICRAISTLAARFPAVHFVYPVHPNPAVRAPVARLLGRPPGANVHLVAPLPYPTFVRLMTRACLILTDSGGVQEEAASLGRPLLVMREATERPEGLEAGCARLVGTDEERIVAEAARLLTDAGAYAAMARAHNPYGDGQAAGRIVEACRAFLAQAPRPA